MIAVDLRLAENAARTCGFVVDADKFRMRLVESDLSYEQAHTMKLSPAAEKTIGDDC